MSSHDERDSDDGAVPRPPGWPPPVEEDDEPSHGDVSAEPTPKDSADRAGAELVELYDNEEDGGS